VSKRHAGLWSSVVLLGLTTIGAYGVAYYAIGVLIPAIADDTGWRAGTLASAFSLGLLLQGGVALGLGRVFDRWGSVLAFGISLAVGAPLLFVASFAAEAWQFILAWTLGAASIGGGLYYNVTMPALGRLFADRRATALSGLTLLGAFASPIFYPLTAALIESMGWRSTLRVLVALLVVIVLPAVLLVRASGGGSPRVRAPGGSFVTALRAPPVYRALMVVALAAFANSAVMLHQISIMEATGLSLAAASGYAGLKGFCQLPGRVTLSPLLRLMSLRALMATCYVLATTSVLALLFALDAGNTTVLLIYFTVVSGVSLGLMSPLSGLFQAEVYGEKRLGTLSGVNVIVVSVAGAAGSWLGGISLDATSSFHLLLAGAMVFQLAAVAALRWQASASNSLADSHDPEAALTTTT